MKTKKDIKAKHILIENNWFRDYYYVKQVIESCLNSNDISGGTYNGVSTIMKARKWGMNVLRDKKSKIWDRYPKYREEIQTIYYRYIEDLRNIFENTFEQISDKLVKNND